MNKEPQTFLIDRNRSVKQAMRQMKEIGQKELFVTDSEGRLFGALSDGDIRMWILREGGLDEPVASICNRNPRVVAPGYELETVKQMLLDYKIEAIPVVDHDRIVADVLVWDEVFRENAPRLREPVNLPVVVMAGGKGTRLDPLTKVLPKPLIPIGEKPIIEIIIDRFVAAGVMDFYLSINHKAKMIKSYFEEAERSYRVQYIEETMPLGTAGGLRLVKGQIGSPFFVTNCDIVIDSDYGEIARFHRDHQNDLTIVVSCKRYIIPYGVCTIESGGILKSIKEKPEHDLLVNTGMYVLNAELLELIPEGRLYNFNELIMAAQGKGFRVGVFPISEKSWIDVGQWEEYHKAVKNFHIG
ncbi:MAG: NTP transferase domain-containing protein [Candidatus Omnitrophica bacterium]|nr:NTP transferase domain-containing protein [Candidatus Omnitrophota bacterium]